MSVQLIECVPNFSEGRDVRVIETLVDLVQRAGGVALLDCTMDPDHNRSVITFAGKPHHVAATAVALAGAASQLIDLNRHTGVHPRIGAADVIPFVPVEGISLGECATLAVEAGQRIWSEHGVPVYLYEAAARQPGRRRLEEVRRGGWEVLREAALTDPARAPDIGGPGLHPTAGACVVGARKILIAFNVNLDTADLTVAQAIARRVRHSSGGFPHVKALGLPLHSRNQTQVSMNLTDFELTPLHTVLDAVRSEAAAHGVSVAGSELIGLVPRSALEQAAAHYLGLEHFSGDAVLEARIAAELIEKLK